MKKYLFLFFLLSCCSSSQNISSNVPKIEFSNDLSFEEFRIRLEKYANNNPYPNIDK